ncbi:ABC transporter ATP-binding protein/permease [Rhabdothermincola sp. EGI L10124]|nr:ABC transporter ATP-binding protein/permease [Rhabdothermincola salaria]
MKAPPPTAGDNSPLSRPRGAGVPVEEIRDFGSATRRLFGRLRRQRTPLMVIFTLTVLAVGMQVVGPRILGAATNVLVDGVTDPDGGIDWGALHAWLGLALGLYIGASGLNYLQAWLLAGVVQGAMRDLRTDVEHKLDRLPLSYVDRTPRGDLLSRVTNDIDNIAQSLQQTLSQMVVAVLTLVGVISMMVLISPLLSLVAIITIPVSIGVVKFIAARSKKRFVRQWGHTGSLNAQVEESITGHAVVKAFGRAPEVEERFRQTNDELYQASWSAQFMAGIIQPIMFMIGNLNFVIVAVLGGLQVASGQLSLGGIQAFIQYSRQFSMPLTQVASMFNVFQSGIASAERVFDLLDAEEQSSDATAEPLAGPVRGRVVFDDVSFSYLPDTPLITELSLVAEPGQTIAIVGPTGAGKTTLVNLLMRFYELDGGHITVDGRDIAGMRRHDLRSQFGMVLQDTWLFGGTIRENIRYGNPAATDDQVLEAARATYVDRFVGSLPDGYDTILDDQHGSVSAGEKQLITIARAFLADPAILILDEATSSVDTRTEVLIQHAMAALRSDRTSFVIAHRLSTIRDADAILVMEDGRIVEQGDHDELLAREGAYATLFMAQFAAAVTDVDAD